MWVMSASRRKAHTPMAGLLAVVLLVAGVTNANARIPSGLLARFSRQIKQDLPRPVDDTGFTTPQLVNDRPIFGVLTQPGDIALEGESYISAGYVKWLEAAGARVLPIPYDLNHKEIRYLFSIVNGLLFPGGNYPLDQSTTWFQTSELLFNLTIDANDAGVQFPLHGTCLGLEAIGTILTKDQYILEGVDSADHPARLDIAAAATRSRLLGGMDPGVLSSLVHEPLTFHNHHFAFTDERFKNSDALSEFFDVLAHTTSKDGKRYASILEARKYPITAFAFHPEKISFEFTPHLHIPHSRVAVNAANQLAAAVVQQARRNNHGGRDIVEEDSLLIYNWTPQFYGRHDHPEDDRAFEQVYIFRAHEYRAHVRRNRDKLQPHATVPEDSRLMNEAVAWSL